MTNIALGRTERPAEAPEIENTAADTPTLTQHARALADELRGGPVAASLAALANECERLQHKYEALQADREMWREFGGDALTTAEMLRDALDSARRSARAWKRAAKFERNAAIDARVARTSAQARERGANAALQAEIEREATAADRWHTTACEMRDVARRAVEAWRESRDANTLHLSLYREIRRAMDEDAATLYAALDGLPEVQPDGRYVAVRAAAAITRLRAELDRTQVEREAWYWQAMQTPVREVREAWQSREGERE